MEKNIYDDISIDEAKARLRSGKSAPPWLEVDAGIKPILKVFYEEGIETFESCQGGPGHCFPEPTVRFTGGLHEGFRALSIAIQYDLKPTKLRRYYSIQDKEPVGSDWEMTFHIPGLPDWRDVGG
jgi:hypothetical protein